MRWAVALGAAAALVAVVGWRWLSADAGTQARHVAAPNPSTATALSQEAGGGASGAPSPAGPEARQQQLVLWQNRYMRAEQIYNSYRDATRYPPESRPLTEHPDQVRPFDPIAEEVALRDASGRPAKGLRIRTTQERVWSRST